MTYADDVVAAVAEVRSALDRSRKTVICHPRSEARIAGLLEQAGLAHLATLRSSPFLPEDQIYVLDWNSLKGRLQ